MNIIETHTHLAMAEFDADREEVLDRARNIGVKYFIAIGIDIPSSRKAIDLASRHHDISAAIGIHPTETGKSSGDELKVLMI